MTDAYRSALSAFVDIGGALGAVHDLDVLLHLIALRMCELSGARRCSIYLRDPESPMFRGQVGHPGDVDDKRIKRLVAGVPADRFTQEIVASKRPVALSNALADPRPIRSVMREWNIRSILGVPMILRGEVVGLAFVDDEDRPHTFSPADCELAAAFANLAAVAISQVRVAEKLRSSVATVTHQNKLLRCAAATDDRLSALMLQGGDLQEIARAVAEITSKPASIHDGQHHRLALAIPPWFDEEVVPRLLDAPYREHPSVVEALAGIAGTRGGVVEPLFAAGLSQRFLVVPVTARDAAWGHLVVVEYGSRFRALDLHAARRAATNIAMELTAERRAAAAELDARASLAADLIRGNGDRAALERRAAFLGVDPAAPRVLCLVTTDPSDADAPSSAEICAALADGTEERDVLTANVADGVVALLELPVDIPTMEAIAAARDRVARALARLPHRGVAAALSTACARPGEYERAYGEARQVMHCLRTLSGNGNQGAGVLTADDLGPGRLVLAAAERTEARRFARDALGALLAGDDGMCDLLATLQAFFDHGRSVRGSALALGVHENTIRYRLARIEQLTGLAVACSSDDQLSAHIALLVLRLEGALPPAPESQDRAAGPLLGSGAA